VVSTAAALRKCSKQSHIRDQDEGRNNADPVQGGGKDDSATGVGSEVNKIQEAVEVARKVYKSKVEGV
jgi:hypothetical protein